MAHLLLVQVTIVNGYILTGLVVKKNVMQRKDETETQHMKSETGNVNDSGHNSMGNRKFILRRLQVYKCKSCAAQQDGERARTMGRGVERRSMFVDIQSNLLPIRTALLSKIKAWI